MPCTNPYTSWQSVPVTDGVADWLASSPTGDPNMSWDRMRNHIAGDPHHAPVDQMSNSQIVQYFWWAVQLQPDHQDKCGVSPIDWAKAHGYVDTAGGGSGSLSNKTLLYAGGALLAYMLLFRR